ncbi:GNAT family N-acetyltransferase [Guptibacillus hwajinpoensis]|uniref:Ribosomal protein S18 acetylase RimI-like enzyme n=1 Tax=Guptibacillus hwajinpoensis TaxID=208199 RepID=A0ABU0K336_9BACL|nr:GNAT family N-acetyltransferase [Alkalihalobacillus hemicentroti]MDQ0483767.1 ribosomal protein S18 acetylase RimI-like enzyme [Alkalihalobacillus hemicentroti]
MEIRRLTADDAEAYYELRLEALKKNPEAYAASYEEAIQKDDPIEQTARNMKSGFTFGAFEGKDLVGVVTLVRGSGMKVRHKADLFAVYVTPEQRGKGVGRDLLSHVLEFARSLDGLLKLSVSVVTTNERAKALYKSFGFKTILIEEKALYVKGTFLDEEHMVQFL